MYLSVPCQENMLRKPCTSYSDFVFRYLVGRTRKESSACVFADVALPYGNCAKKLLKTLLFFPKKEFLACFFLPKKAACRTSYQRFFLCCPYCPCMTSCHMAGLMTWHMHMWQGCARSARLACKTAPMLTPSTQVLFWSTYRENGHTFLQPFDDVNMICRVSAMAQYARQNCSNLKDFCLLPSSNKKLHSRCAHFRMPWTEPEQAMLTIEDTILCPSMVNRQNRKPPAPVRQTR